MISIVIPTFNNLNCLKLCIASIKKNSKFTHEIKLHINDGSDGTIEYAKKNNIFYTHSHKNIGLCSAINMVSSTINEKYILYAHDDMYFCPDWDVSLIDEIKSHKNDKFFLSGTLIEANTGHIRFNCGDNPSNFDEKRLLNNYKNKNFYDYQGSHYAPHLVSKRIWDKVGGFSEEFNPGVGSDPDFNMKLWVEGVRVFKGINNFKVYHFVSTVINRINNPTKNKMNIRTKANKIFLLKWGISIKFFKKHYLKSDNIFTGQLTEPNKNIFYFLDLIKCKIAYFFHFFAYKLNK